VLAAATECSIGRQQSMHSVGKGDKKPTIALHYGAQLHDGIENITPCTDAILLNRQVRLTCLKIFSFYQAGNKLVSIAQTSWLILIKRIISVFAVNSKREILCS
jgi:hypothetical protein